MFDPVRSAEPPIRFLISLFIISKDNILFLLEKPLHILRSSWGITNLPCGQLKLFLVSLTSSSPSGDPCEDDLDSLLGEPNPIFVLHAISVGPIFFLAEDIAFEISKQLCPSILIVFQP